MGLPVAKLNFEQFIDWENEQVERHEFYRGEISRWWVLDGFMVRRQVIFLQRLGGTLKIHHAKYFQKV